METPACNTVKGPPEAFSGADKRLYEKPITTRPVPWLLRGTMGRIHGKSLEIAGKVPTDPWRIRQPEEKDGGRVFDWTFVTHYAPFFVNGSVMTLFISVFGIVFSIAIGLICAGIEIARIPVLKHIVRAYIELSRNTPLLVQLYFLYFGLPKLGIVWSAEQCAIAGLGFLGGSYMAEAMRGGLETIPNVQRESAYVLGLSQWQTLSRVVIPQAISTSIPGVVANVIFLIKESSVVSAIALADVMYMAKDLIGMYYSTYESLLMLVVAYLVILLPISLFGTWLERRFDYERR